MRYLAMLALLLNLLATLPQPSAPVPTSLRRISPSASSSSPCVASHRGHDRAWLTALWVALSRL